MKSLLRCTLFTFLFFGVLGFGFGQDQCGTRTPTKQEMVEIIRQEKAFKQSIGNAPNLIGSITIYIKFHNVVRSDGSGRDISSSISTILYYLNQKYASVNVTFAQSGGIDYIFSSNYYNFYQGCGGIFDETNLRNGRDVTNAINIYFVGTITNGTGCNPVNGYAYYPTLPNSKSNNTILIRTEGTDWNSVIMQETIPHEVGHYFNLYHTHEDGGDLVDDTPFDPQNSSCVFSCTWICSTYNPDVRNLMSYYHGCRNRFTYGQYQRMENYGKTYRTNLNTDFSQRYYLDGLRKVFISPTTSNRLFCGGSSISFDYGIYGEPNFVNATSSVRLTNTVGGYYDLGNLSLGQNFKTITIPSNIPTGYYKLSINNSYTSPDVFTDVDIYINGVINGTLTGSPISSQYSNATSTNYNATSTCLGNSITLYGNIQGYDTYWWTKDGQNFTVSSTDSYFNASSTGTYTLNMIKCGNVYKSSNSIYLSFYDKTTPSITASIGGVSSNTKLAVCDGSIVGLSSGCQGGMNLTWQDGNTSSFRYYNASSTRDFVVSCSNYFCNSANSPPVRITTVVEPNIQSVKTGNWQAPDTWSCNCVPLNCQNVTVQTGHTVSVPVTDAKAKNITIKGILNFQNPTPSTKGKVGLGGS